MAGAMSQIEKNGGEEDLVHKERCWLCKAMVWVLCLFKHM